MADTALGVNNTAKWASFAYSWGAKLPGAMVGGPGTLPVALGLLSALWLGVRLRRRLLDTDLS